MGHFSFQTHNVEDQQCSLTIAYSDDVRYAWHLSRCQKLSPCGRTSPGGPMVPWLHCRRPCAQPASPHGNERKDSCGVRATLKHASRASTDSHDSADESKHCDKLKFRLHFLRSIVGLTRCNSAVFCKRLFPHRICVTSTWLRFKHDFSFPLMNVSILITLRLSRDAVTCGVGRKE